ncbi:MAG: amine dehydrogenase [Proteobacteria bacterium]|nr:amine dehydrogenase [Pseudomonadota bacterium]
MASLPEPTEHWIFAHDVGFYSLTSGKILLIDVASDTRNVLGLIGAAQLASFRRSLARGELYVGESFFSRGNRGDLTDVLSIYEGASLRWLGEVVLPGTKRFQVVPQKAALQLTGDARFALVFNFTPASSVTVVNLDERRVANEIDLPGCMLTYPFGESGFATLCGDGSLRALTLDVRGRVVRDQRTEPFNDIDGDPQFMKAAWVGRTAYFPTFGGSIRPLDLTGPRPEVRPSWPLESSLESAPEGARPSGWQVISADANGLLYVLMRTRAGPGEHKSGGQTVWVVDPVRRRVPDIIPLVSEGYSIEATRGEKPLLVVTNIGMQMDVYDPRSHTKLRTIGNWGPTTPISLYAVE